jgi:CheY-like chemotaxis protein
MRILVVEDEDLLRELATEMLMHFGYDVVAAPDAASALRLIDGDPPPALLFTDVVMPGELDGFALAREAKRRRPGLRVIYATGYARRADSEELLGPLLQKPYRAEQLHHVIEKALSED